MPLLGLRFALELALLVSVGLVGAQAPVSSPWNWLMATGLVMVVAVVWGVFLAPRRRVDLPLWVRVVVEVALFASAAAGLAWIGHPTWGLVLLVAEIVVLSALWRLGAPPGSLET